MAEENCGEKKTVSNGLGWSILKWKPYESLQTLIRKSYFILLPLTFMKLTSRIMAEVLANIAPPTIQMRPQTNKATVQ